MPETKPPAQPGVSLVRPVETSSAGEQVTKEIRRAIVSGALRPQQKFSLREIATQLNVSFIPVREALRALEGEGLIISSPGRSPMVAPLSADDLHGIYRLRRRIEPEIAGRSCPLLNDSDFHRLNAFIEMSANPQMGIDDIYDAHHEFHIDLLRPAATAWDLRILGVLWHAGERYVRLAFGSMDAQPDEHDRRAEVHAHLIDEFRTHDPRRASQAWVDHLEDNEKLARLALEAVIE
jgi:DNA-binding GntR family transcriptional regulator